MRDWKAIAKAITPEVPSEELDRLLPPLAALEEVFRPLAQGLKPEIEPATGLHLERESQ